MKLDFSGNLNLFVIYSVWSASIHNASLATAPLHCKIDDLMVLGMLSVLSLSLSVLFLLFWWSLVLIRTKLPNPAPRSSRTIS